MRNSGTLSWSFAKSLTAELGYMNQYRFNRNADDVMEHVFLTTASLRF